METRARHALIGLFMLAVIIASFAFVYWLENKGGFGERTAYQIRFGGSTSGLLVGSSVLFNGIRVGEVTGLGLDPEHPEQVVATIGVDPGTPIRSDTQVGIETQGLTGGAVVTLRGGSATAEAVPPQGVLMAPPQAGQDWTQAARDAFQRVDDVLAENSDALHSAITNIDTFAGALARNSDKVDGILAGLEKMTGGGTSQAQAHLFDLVAANKLPSPPQQAPSWLLVVPEPTTLMGFNTDKILLQPASGESADLPNAKWSDNLPVLFQDKVIQSFENAGYAKSISRTREGITGDYQLLIDIRSFHVSTATEPTVADIAFVAKVLDKDGKIVGAHAFQATAPAKGSDARAYVAALDEAFAKLQSDLLVWTTETISNAPPAPAAAPAPPIADTQP
ncbi:MAG TPA: ABC-type transport auxiliary lipoprotein family protein [Methyloceanibacter sp.]|nr:ABC-type transport auxiliary lipoprotein family protein [Methyloceanibacter sp.]